MKLRILRSADPSQLHFLCAFFEKKNINSLVVHPSHLLSPFFLVTCVSCISLVIRTSQGYWKLIKSSFLQKGTVFTQEIVSMGEERNSACSPRQSLPHFLPLFGVGPSMPHVRLGTLEACKAYSILPGVHMCSVSFSPSACAKPP